jgi:hypothetical protein
LRVVGRKGLSLLKAALMPTVTSADGIRTAKIAKYRERKASPVRIAFSRPLAYFAVHKHHSLRDFTLILNRKGR